MSITMDTKPRRTPRTRSYALVCFLVWTGLALGCEWDENTDRKQTLDVDLSELLQAEEAQDADSCRAACCARPDCDLALLGHPMDAAAQCFLVTCWVQGRNRCAFKESEQFEVFLKKAKSDAEPRAAETGNVRCRLPVKVGACRASFPRFYYDPTNQSCRSFTYGGCDANENNFESEEECKSACSGVSGSVLPVDSTQAPPLRVKAARMVPASKRDELEDLERAVEAEAAEDAGETVMSAEDFAERCEAEPEVGHCRAAFERWHYIKDEGRCKSFIYGGCKGNQNNYASEESCMAACTVVVVPSSRKVVVDEDVSQDFKAQCLVTSDPGRCRAAFSMFYHDADSASCLPFIYGGCGGNENRYSSLEECESRCMAGSRFSPRSKRWTGGVFLFVTLAGISALVLGTLLIITLRRHNMSRRPSSVSDKQELLPDELSSAESLSVPDSPKPDKA